MTTAAHIAEILLKERAVFLRHEDPFTWTSGIRSPVYCDNRLLISTVDSRRVIVDAFCQQLSELKLDAIAGTATAGIPWAAWIAMQLSLPMVYVRSAAKEHGRKSAIEGQLPEGSKVALIEDLISTGKSSIAAAEQLRSAGMQVEKVMSIFSYDFPQAHQLFQAKHLPLSSLSTFEVLAQVAYDQKTLDAATLQEVLEWRKKVVFP
jgi:orotate phosphoribosyltransferase